MDPINVLKVFVKLEKDIAAFYRKLKNISSISQIVKTYDKMERQSANHAERIMKDYKSFRINDLDIAPLIVLHNHVKRNLLEEIKNESNILFILQKLADAEEQLGKIYKSIALHYKKNAEKYIMLSEAIDKIGDEEYAHRDAILLDMKKEAEKMEIGSRRANPEETLAANDYKTFQRVFERLNASLDELNLRDNEHALIRSALDTVGQSLIDSRQKIDQCVKQCREVLKFQKQNKQIASILEALEEIQSRPEADLRMPRLKT